MHTAVRELSPIADPGGAVSGTRWTLGILFILTVHERVLWDCFPAGQLTHNKPEARNIWRGTQPSTLSSLENVDIYPKKCFWGGGGGGIKNFGQHDSTTACG